jgi:hypothetical protein
MSNIPNTAQCGAPGSDGEYYGFLGTDLQTGTTPTRYYNQDDCKTLGGTWTKVEAMVNNQTVKTYMSPTFKTDIGKCVIAAVGNKPAVNLSTTCAILPAKFVWNRLTGQAKPAVTSSTAYGPGLCSAPNSTLNMDLTPFRNIHCYNKLLMNPLWQ